MVERSILGLPFLTIFELKVENKPFPDLIAVGNGVDDEKSMILPLLDALVATASSNAFHAIVDSYFE